MQRYTTPKHTFKFSVNPDDFVEFRITYKQKGRTVLEKTEEDEVVVRQDNNVYFLEYNLTQEETKKFSPGKASVQIRAIYANGETVASEKFDFLVADVYNHEILGGE